MTKRVRPVDLAELRAQYKGTRFYGLIQHQLRRQSQERRSQERRTQGVQGTVLMLPESAQALAEGFIDRWNARAYDREFWQTDTAAVFDEIIEDARTVLRPLGFATDDEAAFDLFNIVVLSYAYSAYDQPKMREFMGVSRVRFPIPEIDCHRLRTGEKRGRRERRLRHVRHGAVHCRLS
jgi:hypothetical protein